MLNKSLTTTILIIILVLATAVVSAKDQPKVKEGAGCKGLTNASSSMPANSNGKSSVDKQIEVHGCAPADPQDDDDNNPPTDDGGNPPTDDGGNPPTDDGGNPPTDDGGNDIVLGTGVLQITLVWDNLSNLELTVAEPPYGEIIYWGNTESYGGGKLDYYVTQCGESPYAENIYWENDAPHGEYVIQVAEESSCGTGSSANWTLTIRVDGVLVEEHTGTGNATFTFTY